MADPQKRPNSLYVTGRLPLLVAVGTVPVVLLSTAGFDAWLTAWGWVALCTLLTLGDAAAAPDPRAVAIERTAARRVLLGQSAVAEMRLRHPPA